MAKITNRFVHFKTKASFTSRLGAGDIQESSVVFIQDANEIWTHGTYYKCDISEAEVIALINSKGYITEADIPSLTGGAAATSGQYVSGVTVSGHNVTVTKAALPTSVSGNAGTATKLATSRVIAIAGAVSGSATFDGSTNISISTTLANIDASKITSGTLNADRLPEIPDPITVDDTLSTTSTNPVQNKVVATALNNKVNNATLGSYVKTADLNVTLGNYYTTAEVYTKNEVDDKIGSAGGGDVMASGDLANNYIIIGAGSKSIKKSEQLLSDLALKSDIPSLDGYATESWVGTQNFITMPDDLAEDRIVIGAGTNSVTSKRLKTINGVSLLVDDTYNVTNFNVNRIFPWYALTGSGNITGLYNYLFNGVGQLVSIKYNNRAYTNLPVDGESFVGTLQPYKYTAANNWSVRAFLTSENTGKTYTGVFKMGQSALINWIEIGKDITSSEIVSALGFTPISSNEIPVALPNPYALTINGTSYTGSSAVDINTARILSTSPLISSTVSAGYSYNNTSSRTISSLSGFSSRNPDSVIISTAKLTFTASNAIKMDGLADLSGTYYIYCLSYMANGKIAVNGAVYA